MIKDKIMMLVGTFWTTLKKMHDVFATFRDNNKFDRIRQGAKHTEDRTCFGKIGETAGLHQGSIALKSDAAENS